MDGTILEDLALTARNSVLELPWTQLRLSDGDNMFQEFTTHDAAGQHP